MKKGFFFTFEGIDGCGKSTQMRFLAEYLQSEGFDYILTREPGGCPIAEQIREILLNVANKSMDYQTEALLYAAARVQHIKDVIVPAVKEGKIVLCDRFLDSSIAYQGYGRELGETFVREINAYALAHAVPDATFFFECSPARAFSRMNPAKQMDRLEQENMAFFERVFAGYEAIAAAEPKRVIKIDALGSKYETRDKLRMLVGKWFDQQGR